MSDEPVSESVGGWVRLGLSAGATALLPLWVVLVALNLHREPEVESSWFVLRAVMGGTLIVGGIAVLAALLLVLMWGGARLLATLRPSPHVASVDVDGGDLPEDAWRDLPSPGQPAQERRQDA